MHGVSYRFFRVRRLLASVALLCSCFSVVLRADGGSTTTVAPSDSGIAYWDWGNGFHDFGAIMETWLGGIWSIMAAEMPLIGLTWQQFFLGFIGASIGLVILRRVGLIDGSVPRTSSTTYPKIAANRKDDEF